MDIKLTAKDADFILKFIRTDLQRVCETSAKIRGKQTELEAMYEKSEKSDLIKLVWEMAKEAGTLVSEDMTEIRHDLERCVELLTVGSEVTE